MRYAVASIALLCAVPATAAETKTVQPQPVCDRPEQLAEVVEAMGSSDMDWLASIKTCKLVPGGFRMVILERNVSAGRALNLAKVRVLLGDGESDLGYTILLPEQR